MALVMAHNAVYGDCLIPEGKLRLHPDVWRRHDPTFDPDDHTAAEVVAYLRDTEPAERARVLAAERAAARPRKTVLAEDTQTPAPGAGEHTTQTGATPGTSTED